MNYPSTAEISKSFIVISNGGTGRTAGAREQKDIIISNSPESARGSPRPARAGGNLVGRGIANPMSERTRGFEMLPWGGTSIPLPALFSFVIFLNFLDSLVRIQVSMTQIKLSIPKYV
jgi:hypothetical protein